jgi:error-prone DNA polymerase
MVGAMDVWGVQRRKLLWELGKLRYEEDELDLAFPDDQVKFAPISQTEAMAAEYGILGLSTGDHVISLYRRWLKEQGILDSQEVESCEDGQKVQVAGLVVVHQAPPTAKGHHFITLEDEMGLMNVIVRPDVYQQHRHVLHGALLLIVEGVTQCRDGVTNVLARQLTNMPRVAGSQQ